jgi:hypothetical protein
MGKGLISCCCLLLLSSLAYAGKCIDDFENGNADGWNEASGDWEVQNGAYVQLGAGKNVMGIPHTIIESPWEFSDGTIEVTIIFSEESDGTEVPAILYRMIDEDNGYAFRLRKEAGANNEADRFIMEVGKFLDGQFDYIRGDAFPVDIGKPCKIKLEVEGMFTKAYYDGIIRIRVGDLTETFDKGKIGLAVFDANEPVYFDDVIINGEGIFPFLPLSEKVDPGGKLASVWGQIKANS